MPKTSIVISNTTPIIALSIIGKLQLLEQLYGEVLIPLAVEQEILAGGVRAGAKELSQATYIRTVPVSDPTRAMLLQSELDQGEAEVIVLGQELNADLVIIDERLARLHASRLGLNLTGVVGVILKAKKFGYVAEIRPILDQLCRNKIRLGTGLINEALRIAGEG